MGYSDLGCYGGEIATPNLDRLAAGGLRFTQFYNSAKCEPTRASLMSGQYWQDCGLGIKKGLTMGQAMRPAGYATFALGKWHLAGNPVDRGFDHYFGHLSGASDYFKGSPSHRLDDKPFKPADDGKFYTTDANADYAIKFLDELHQKQPKKPFFMYLAFNAPHATAAGLAGGHREVSRQVSRRLGQTTSSSVINNRSSWASRKSNGRFRPARTRSPRGIR